MAEDLETLRIWLAVTVRERRIAKGWSQGDFARDSGVSMRWIKQIEDPESGSKPGLEVLYKMAKALGIETAVLLTPQPAPATRRQRVKKLKKA